MINKAIVKQNFGRYADEYEQNARLQRRVASELISRSKKLRGKILDIGAGTGFIGKETDWDLVELDISPEMCARLKSPVNADMENLPFKDESFDNIISSLAFQWAADLDMALKEANRVLKKGGALNFSTFTTGSLKELETSFSFLDDDRHTIEFEPTIRLFARLKKAGFNNLVINSQRITYKFNGIMPLLKTIKNIGASYGHERKNKTLKGKKYFTQLENIYKSKFETDGALPLTWEILYITASK